jgi:GTP:adenosylcobinamide-phosphate guanylyltransferase
MTRWTAILLAGERPGGDPLASAEGVRFKALIPVAGEAMVSRVVRTLLACPSIGRIVVLAQEPDALLALAPGWIAADPRVTTAVGSGGISASLAAVAGGEVAPWPVLVTTADHPLLTPAMVEHFLAGVGDADVGVAMAERTTVLTAYPDNRRTWLRLRGGAWSGANLFALRGPRARGALTAWAAVEQDRKKAWRLLVRFGPWLALRALTRTISLHDAIARAGRRLGLTARLVAMPQAEAAIDVDKPADLALAAQILARRMASAGG